MRFRIRQAIALSLLLTACPGGPSWSVLSPDGMNRVALSAWGPSPRDVFVSGGGLGNGQPSMWLHLSGGKWNSIDLAGSVDTLWWTFGFSASDVYAVGERGAIWHYDGSVATRLDSGTTATLFGIWGASPSELWAVGGSPDGSGPTDVILRYDGAKWSSVAPPAVLGVPYLKIWGSAPDDVFIVGQQGVLLHYDGVAWSKQDSTTHAGLITVSGYSRDDVWAVGGPPSTLLHFDGSSWSRQDGPGLSSGLGGVSYAGPILFVVGLAGVKWRRDASGKWHDDSDALPHQDLHGVFGFADGSAMAVGGNYSDPDPAAPRKGVIAFYGVESPPRTP